MQPQRMIQAGSHELLFEQRPAVRRKRSIEEHHVGCVGQHALMNGRQIGQFAGRADPDVELPAGNFLAEIAFEFDRAQFDRSLAFIIASDRIGIIGNNFSRISASLGSFSGGGTSGILAWWSRPGSSAWNDTAMEKIGCPCCRAVTRRVVKLLPSRIRSTS